MIHIIIEGGDRLGKSELIKGICNHFDYDNIIIRHFGKPPSYYLHDPKQSIRYQFEQFNNEADILNNIYRKASVYYENIIIWNRSHLGEYVYSQMFRGVEEKEVKKRLLKYENRWEFDGFERYLITLTADPKFFLSKEDGQSFSQNLEQKTKELELFKEVHSLSKIKDKLLIKVNDGDIFRNKKDILNETINFIQ